MREHDWVDENSLADADRPASYAKTVALRAHFRGEDLRRDEERSRAPGRGVNEAGQEEHGNCSRCDGGRFGPAVSGCFVERLDSPPIRRCGGRAGQRFEH